MFDHIGVGVNRVVYTNGHILTSENAKEHNVDKRLACEAPICWAKYTTQMLKIRLHFYLSK